MGTKLKLKIHLLLELSALLPLRKFKCFPPMWWSLSHEPIKYSHKINIHHNYISEFIICYNYTSFNVNVEI